MGYLTTKYKGKYRLKCEVDKVTNDFPKTLKDTYEDADVYIDCSFGNKIFYYGKGILQSYIPSLQRGRNIIRMRKKMLKGKEFIHSEGHWNDYLKYLRKEIPNA